MNHQVRKPNIFISHATSDAEFANAVKSEIEKVFADGLNVFCTSSPGAIPVGNDWLTNIEEKLKNSQCIIPIITPVSIERPWLWFELGATWLKGRSGDNTIYPLCASEIKLSELPPPLNRLQALSLGNTNDLKQLFEALIEQFGFAKIGSFKSLNIIKRVPLYKNVIIEEVDKNERSLYSGKYSGYTDDELIEVIKTLLIEPDEKKLNQNTSFYRHKEELIHNGKLIHFRDVDRNLDLPSGTSKRLLTIAASYYELIADMETENIVRYKREEEEENDEDTEEE